MGQGGSEVQSEVGSGVRSRKERGGVGMEDGMG